MPTYQWQQGDAGGQTFFDVAGAVDSFLTLPASPAPSYRALVDGVASPAYTPGGGPPPPSNPALFYENLYQSPAAVPVGYDTQLMHLSGHSPAGFVSWPAPNDRPFAPKSGYCVQNNVWLLDPSQSGSTTGEASVAYMASGSAYPNANDFNMPYTQQGRDTWFGIKILIPDGRDPRYPGTFTLSPWSSGWDYLIEWHYQQGSTAYPNVGLYGTGVMISNLHTVAQSNGVTNRPFDFRVVGGVDTGPNTMIFKNPSWIWQYNTWYAMQIRLKFGLDANTGYVEWWINDVQEWSQALATIGKDSATGTVPGVAHEIGLYRGPAADRLDTLYFAEHRIGAARADVR